MELTGIGGGLMVAIAAALWLVYLVPNWFKRREYLATERNAVRLQQTIRVLAETAEIPAEVRADAAARRLAQAQRAEYRQGPVAVGRPVQKRLPSDAELRATARRLRRTRAIAMLALLGSLVLGVAQFSLLLTTAAGIGAWIALAIAAAGVIVSFSVLGRAAERTRAQQAPVATSVRRTSLGAAPVRTAAPQTVAWTPVAVPKPLYLSRATAEPQTAAATDAQFELEIAAASAQRALRERESAVPAVAVAAKPAAAASRFASMGVVDDTSRSAPDLDAVLARRRAAG